MCTETQHYCVWGSSSLSLIHRFLIRDLRVHVTLNRITKWQGKTRGHGRKRRPRVPSATLELVYFSLWHKPTGLWPVDQTVLRTEPRAHRAPQHQRSVFWGTLWASLLRMLRSHSLVQIVCFDLLVWYMHNNSSDFFEFMFLLNFDSTCFHL